MSRTAGPGSVAIVIGVCASACLPVLPLDAQEAGVPRTRTFTGLVSPAFPYAQPEEVGVSKSKLDRLGDDIVEWIATGELVGAELLVIKEGKAVAHEAYGWSDREARLPMRRNSIFAIQSMSKPFTATAVLMLAEEGALALNDPVSRYVPGFTHDSITIRHLLTHTSGFTHDGDWYDYQAPDASLEDLVESWPHRDPERALGDYDYADFNYAHLAYIVDKVAGLSVDAFIEERVIRPLGLEDTSTGFSSAPEWRARLNPWYRWNDRARAFDLRQTSNWPGWRFYPGGWGLLSTAMDYAEFMAMWMDNGQGEGRRLLRPETVDTALQQHARTGPTTGYGYGWETDRGEGRPQGWSFWHGGGGGTLAMAFPADDLMVVYLTHSRWGTHRAAFSNRVYSSGLIDHPGLGLAFNDMEWATEEEVARPALPAQARSRYVGTYLVPDPEGEFEAVRVWEERGLLHVGLGRSGAKADRQFHLVPLGADLFALGRYEDGVLEGVDPIHTLSFRVEQGVPGRLDVLENGSVMFAADRRH